MARRNDADSRTPAQPLKGDVAAAAAGDQDAWDRLVDRHAQRVWSTARAFGLDVAAASLVCQLSWIRLADHLDALRSEEQLCNWLCAAAEHEARAILYPE
jgi:DNA-directed RNA polymerase specialized sigma24 family protein